MRLDTPEAIFALMRTFDLKEDEIAELLRDHDIDPTGIIHYGLLMAGAAAKEGQSTIDTMIAVFVAGVTLGLHLADEHATQEPLSRLRLLQADDPPPQEPA